LRFLINCDNSGLGRRIFSDVNGTYKLDSAGSTLFRLLGGGTYDTLLQEFEQSEITFKKFLKYGNENYLPTHNAL